jgi:acyl-coenzyme A thioesterase PaaI-like protein
MHSTDAIRRAVLQGLARDRTPGWSFTGHFQHLQWPVIGRDAMTVTLPAGAHNQDLQGDIDLTALLVLFDAALASPTRLNIGPGTRIATSHINVQFTGARAKDDARVEARKIGATQTGALPQLLAHGALWSGDDMIMSGNGAFVQIAPPAGVREMAPLPWQRKGFDDPAPLAVDRLDARERAVLAACDAALAAQRNGGVHSFLDHFWGIAPQCTPEGAHCTVQTGPQLANRVGHVQGGILMGMAAATARCAVPDHPVLSNLSAWFTGPGRGAVLEVKSWPVHQGRSFAVVRTEITGGNGARVLEVTSAHAA